MCVRGNVYACVRKRKCTDVCVCAFVGAICVKSNLNFSTEKNCKYLTLFIILLSTNKKSKKLVLKPRGDLILPKKYSKIPHRSPKHD